MADEKKVDITFGWEDGGCASVDKFICSCGANLIKSQIDYTVSDGTYMDCPKCKKAYKFVWAGMTIKEVGSLELR